VWMSDDFNAPLDDLQRIYVMGRFLLDTHVFLWLIQGDPQLSSRVRAIIADDTNQLNFSVVSIWEIAIKLNIGKLKIEHSIEDIYQLLAQLKIEILPFA
jgi:PIN domain nuclease of toxin-antitoxin system